MDSKESLVKDDAAADQSLEESSTASVSDRIVPSRRRLFRQGAAVVAVTLVSRPVFACDCKAPSAWGASAAASVNTNGASYSFTVWTVADWAGSQTPWNSFNTVRGTSFNYSQVTLANLQSAGVTLPVGLTVVGTKVRKVLNGAVSASTFQIYTLVAQLNFLALAARGDIDRCVKLADLQNMARLTFAPSNKPNVLWTAGEITDYLYNNWIVR
jgi:hypothetical protein